MKTIFFLLLMLTTSFVFSQIGNTTITFNDPSRTGGFGSGGGAGRQIQCEIYYPAASNAANVPVVGSNLPVLVFGHGFVMGWDSYTNLWEYYVPKGYIMVFPRTEGSFSPVHADFGKDLALVADTMKKLNDLSGSLFFQKLNKRVAVMGHSMGGGSSILAAQNKSTNQINTIVNFAAAVTNPSSVTAGQYVSIPSFVIAAQNDCVAPPADHQLLEYDSLFSAVKMYTEVKGGGHCYFANTNFNCSLGEGTCTPNPTISRAQQQDAAQYYALLWLNYYLKDNCADWKTLNDSVSISNRISSYKRSYVYPTAVNIIQNGSTLSVSGSYSNYQWYYNNAAIPGANGPSIQALNSGNYYCQVTNQSNCTINSNTFNFNATAINGIIIDGKNCLYPNPFNKSLFISNLINNTKVEQIVISDLTGKSLIQQKINYRIDNQGVIDINTENLESGIYFVNIITSSNKLSYKVVKK
jgi:dienelactone hydrolase